MSWQIFLAISVLSFSFSTVLQRIFLKKSPIDPIAFSISFQLLAGVLIGIFVGLRGFHLPNLDQLWPSLVLAIVLYAFGNINKFKALKNIEASQFTILFQSSAIWTIVIAVILLGEKFNIRHGLGALLIIGSVVMIFWKPGNFRLGKGEAFSLLAALIFGVAFANDAYLLRFFDASTYLFIVFVIPALLTWLVYPKSTSQIIELVKSKTLIRVLILTALYAIAAVTVYYAYQYGRNAAQIAPLSQTSTILTVILAVLFLKERSDLGKKILGLVIGFLGVILLQ